jgi:hypothetical protein
LDRFLQLIIDAVVILPQSFPLLLDRPEVVKRGDRS